MYLLKLLSLNGEKRGRLYLMNNHSDWYLVKKEGNQVLLRNNIFKSERLEKRKEINSKMLRIIHIKLNLYLIDYITFITLMFII